MLNNIVVCENCGTRIAVDEDQKDCPICLKKEDAFIIIEPGLTAEELEEKYPDLTDRVEDD